MRRATSEGVLRATIIVSALVHIVIAMVLPRLESGASTVAELPPIEVTMDESPPTVVTPVPVVEAVVPGSVVLEPSATHLPLPAIDTPQVVPNPEVGPQPTEPTVLTVDHNPATTATGIPPTQGLRLDPRAAALASVGTGPVRLAPQAQERPSETTAERDARIGRELAAGLQRDGNVQAYLTTRPTPEPRTLPDGRISFEGVGVTMIFDPRDGSTTFSDRAGFQYEGFGSAASGREGLTASFDLNSAIHRSHGSDPNQAERRWLLRRTESYRDSAQDTARTTQAEGASRSVRGRLQRLLDDEARPIEARRASMFNLWDRCSEDAQAAPEGQDESEADRAAREATSVGSSARRAIIAFIRERMPRGSPTAFTASEIAAMNARRRSTEAFAPY